MRIGVGVGEASLSPAAYSLITDYFPPHRRATAQGIYNIALSLGSGGILRRRHRHWTDVGAVRVDSARGRPHPFLAIGVLHCRTAGRPFGAPDVQCREARAAAPGAEAKKVSLREVLAFAKANRATLICHNVGLALPGVFRLWQRCLGSHLLHSSLSLERRSNGTSLWACRSYFRRVGRYLGKAGSRDNQPKRGYKDACMRVALLSSVVWLAPGIVIPWCQIPFFP